MDGFMTSLPQASSYAANSDALFNFILGFSAIGFVAVAVAIVYFVVRNHHSRRKPEDVSKNKGHTSLEMTMSGFLLVIVMVIFYWGWTGYQKLIVPPSDALTIKVHASSWKWNFEYPNGRIEENLLVVPHGQKVRLVLTAKASEVLHSFFVPAFRIKQDVIPNDFRTIWFEATEYPQDVSDKDYFRIFCTEYCGTLHWDMIAKLKVLSPEQYELWQQRYEFEAQGANLTGDMSVFSKANAAAETGKTSAEIGKELYVKQICNSCHSDQKGVRLVGPSFYGLFGSKRELADGKTVIADEAYIRESIMNPNAKIAKGYPPAMPTYEGQLTNEQILNLIDFIKTLKD